MGYIKDLRKLIGNRPLIMPGACVILMDKDDRILLQLRKDNNCWGLAGGSLELVESLEEAAKRELREETGFIATKLQLFQLYSGKQFYYKYPNGDEVHNVLAAYICTDFTGEMKLNACEVQALHFFHLNDLPQDINPSDLPVIMEFIQQAIP